MKILTAITCLIISIGVGYNIVTDIQEKNARAEIMKIYTAKQNCRKVLHDNTIDSDISYRTITNCVAEGNLTIAEIQARINK